MERKDDYYAKKFPLFPVLMNHYCFAFASVNADMAIEGLNFGDDDWGELENQTWDFYFGIYYSNCFFGN